VVQTIVRTTDWFEPAESIPDDPTAKPVAQVTSVVEDSAGLLWVTSVAATSNWHDIKLPSDAGSLEFADKARLLWETRLEVIDPSTTTLVCTARLDYGLFSLTDWPLYAHRRHLPDGTSVVDIIRLTLHSH
jgi:hypothetical protein